MPITNAPDVPTFEVLVSSLGPGDVAWLPAGHDDRGAVDAYMGPVVVVDNDTDHRQLKVREQEATFVYVYATSGVTCCCAGNLLDQRPKVYDGLMHMGSHFQQGLAGALKHADIENTYLIWKTWPRLWWEARAFGDRFKAQPAAGGDAR